MAYPMKPRLYASGIPASGREINEYAADLAHVVEKRRLDRSGGFLANLAAVAKWMGVSAVAMITSVAPASADAKEKIVANGETVRIQEYPGASLQFTHWVAIDKGFCKAHGLNCQLVPIPSGPVGLQALAAGSLEVSFGSTDVTMQAASRGNDVQLITGHSPGNVYVLSVRKGVPLPNLSKGYPAVMQDLKGLKIGVTARGAGTELQTRALFVGAGMSPDAATYVAVGSPGTAYPTFLAQQVDAVMMIEPFAAICRVQKTCVDVVNLEAGEGPAAISSLNGAFVTFAARRDFIKANSKVIDAFIQAMDEATKWVNDPANAEELYKLVKARLKFGSEIADTDAVLRELVRTRASKYATGIDRKAVKALSDYLIENKLITAPVDPASFVYNKAP